MKRPLLVGARVRVISGPNKGRIGHVAIPPAKAEIGRWLELDPLPNEQRRRAYQTLDELEPLP
jgi:hypothetical protein